MSVPYGWAAGVSDEYCIASSVNKRRMLCGRERGFVPVVPPVLPHKVHEECARLWEVGGDHREPVGQYGTCPMCSADVQLTDGRIDSHGMWVVGRSGPRVTTEPCPGAGMLPEPEDAG